MNRCFELLGLDETATIEQIMDAYMRKKAFYSGTAFDEEPQYSKRKLKELEDAALEACSFAEPATDGAFGKDQQEYLYQLLNEDEMHMQKLYHKHLTGRINRAAGVPQKQRSNAQQKVDSAYKRSVLFFWLGIAAVVILIGLII